MFLYVWIKHDTKIQNINSLIWNNVLKPSFQYFLTIKMTKRILSYKKNPCCIQETTFALRQHQTIPFLDKEINWKENLKKHSYKYLWLYVQVTIWICMQSRIIICDAILLQRRKGFLEHIFVKHKCKICVETVANIFQPTFFKQ